MPTFCVINLSYSHILKVKIFSFLYEKPNKTYRKVYLKNRDDENAKPFHPPYAAAHSWPSFLSCSHLSAIILPVLPNP